MFESVKDFLRTLGVVEAERTPLDEASSDPRVAAAALLFHVVDADGRASEAEIERLKAALAQEFGLGPQEADRIASVGRIADQQAVDLYHFTSVLKSRLDADQRRHFVEHLWAVTYADGEVHELEDNLVWRVSELLGVSARERMESKREAAAAARNEALG
ncbi:TerB family tellurite resistance protein [Aurantimonas sp. Leaf443]|uniref:tellurite resistance TerB family protein n=1 Tax=Aurantimonas sp. Leaf443 TaxID=1736378 RepID=UPI0006FE7A4C|nr:TerB family tellurite resistance protein [Aurantimonas sp. Leaf443]KQT85462.1 hypothetical protein ASG48_09540 [Aurantimonas sp. Leaf443]